ncbi:hypothetical protein MPTK1_2g07770 [Marchantia polymorpha subsp. ruderalis]|uniref:Bacterial Ig-like domain-containing protein n=1 Tax=Marchantia polymorpha TaxID=3197 RepID=A0A2R6XGL9_MARPO|nr:hypothetical protein MARPO_0015s0063 [Marchantia polymorpha]BBN01488.1 hypothetical protein Mp_2g07770 [Marchantia polymorpha subsp. ruderalis]|eukprot:PTQ45255.1 hypothetical protein MARPO_0015s0063 [Marchantia polymorpha]
MKKSERWLLNCMDLRTGGLLCSGLVVVLALLCCLSGVEGQDTPAFIFSERPPNVTSNTTATFRFALVAPNGSNPCGADCAVQCELDDAPFVDCADRVRVYSNLSDGDHVFTIFASTSKGVFYTNKQFWTVDTVPPTASIEAGPAFTNAINVSVAIEFSEPCTGNGGFQCSDVSNCSVYVGGPGAVLPSTLRTLNPGLLYTLTVALSSEQISGKVLVTMQRDFCTDVAGNVFQRNENSSFTIRFDRSIPTVNMWTPIQDAQVQINNEYRTISSTNRSEDLIVYLDFSESMVTTTAQLLNLLQTTDGVLSSTNRKSRGNRRFGFLISNVSSVSIITVTLPANSSFSRFGSPVVSTVNVTFLYDSLRPEVTVSTTSLAKTKNQLVPVLIQFSKPVFVFGLTNVTISGGNLTRFDEVSKSTYALEVYIDNDDVVSVSVGENVTYDISVNPNLPSNVLRVRHYTVPAAAVALSSFTTAGLIATILVSGALSISQATLAAAGALTSRSTGYVGADASRNLLGMATHLQVFALSDWLAVSLPVEYRETTRGLRWLIPHVNPPWQSQHNYTSVRNPLFERQLQPQTPMMRASVRARRTLLSDGEFVRLQAEYESAKIVENSLLGGNARFHTTELSECLGSRFPSHCRKKTVPGHLRGGQISPSFWNETRAVASCIDRSRSGRRRLGTNMTLFGPALTPSEYSLYFESGVSNNELDAIFNETKYTGWRDFARNMFWLGAVGGGLILLHVLLLLFLRWRTKTSVRGALTVPRFELFLLVLAIPCMCQASAFIIRGGTILGIIIGVLLLAIPAAYLLSIVLFLIIAVFMGSLVQYKEVVRPRGEDEARSWRSKLVELVAGPNVIFKWVRKDGLAPTFVPRYGIFFEDRKGPPKLIVLDGDQSGSFPKWVESGSNGIGRMRAVNSDDESEEVAVSWYKKLLGGAQASYFIVDIARRITLGVIFGAFARSDESWVQVSIALGVTVFQLVYLVTLKPFIKRGVQVVESISLLCETGLFATAVALLALGHPADDYLGLGIFLLALLLLSFVAQLVNEWYALMKQLLRLSPSQEPSLKLGLKLLGRGLVIPFIPRKHWSRFISPQPPQPRTGLVPVVPMSPEPDLERARRSTSVQQGSPLIATGPEPAIPGYDPGSPAFVDPRNAATEQAVTSGEIKADMAMARQDKPAWSSQWNRSRSMEGKRSTRGVKADPKSSELKMLRELAKASFPRWRKQEEATTADPGLEISSPVPSNLGQGGGASRRKHSSSAPSRVGAAEEHGYTDDSLSDNSSDDEGYGRPQMVGESSLDVTAAPVVITPHSSSSFEKGSKGSGPLEHSGSLPLREVVTASRTPEER